MIHVPTLEESVERAIDLLRLLAQSSVREEIRKEGDALQLADHSRRLLRDGKHPIAGETREQYEEHMDDPIRGGRGVHPVTGETREQYEKEGKSVFGATGKTLTPKA